MPSTTTVKSTTTQNATPTQEVGDSSSKTEKVSLWGAVRQAAVDVVTALYVIFNNMFVYGFAASNLQNESRMPYITEEQAEMAGYCATFASGEVYGGLASPITKVVTKGISGVLTKEMVNTSKVIPDEAFVRFDPTKVRESIFNSGIQTQFFTDEKVWFTKYKYVKNISNSADLEIMLYNKNIQLFIQGKISSGADFYLKKLMMPLQQEKQIWLIAYCNGGLLVIFLQVILNL